MVDDAVVIGDLISDQGDQFIALIRAMDAGGDKNSDVFAVNPGFLDFREQGRQDNLIRYRAGYITDNNAGALACLRNFGKWLCGNRFLQRL